jgi:iron complex outermembrane receptor protein
MKNGKSRAVGLIVLSFIFISPHLARAKSKPSPKVLEGNVDPSPMENTSQASGNELLDLPLEKLLEIQVTSAAKRPQKLSEVPAAITVITGEDIRRMGATTIMDALRMAPGLDVAQISSSQWAITSRGFQFNGFTNKLLVLLDGRSAYDKIFGGVNWDQLDTFMEDVDRIEIIRGPGGTLWGANATNGVINIITKNAKETHGGLVTAGGGLHERGFGGVRYGDKVGEDFHWRTFVKAFSRGSFTDATGGSANDAWWKVLGGMRMDWDLTDNDSLTLQGDLQKGRSGYPGLLVSLTDFPFMLREDVDVPFSEGNIITRWGHRFSERSDFTLQSYYDRSYRDTGDVFLGKETVHTFDIDGQYNVKLGSRHQVSVGGEYRVIRMSAEGTFFATLVPSKDLYHLFSGFLQDEITLVRDKLFLTLGSKFEHESFDGFNIQPTARLLWNPHPDHQVWAAVSRAVATSNSEVNVPRENVAALPDPSGSGLPILTSFFRSPNPQSETVLALELGYRVQAIPRISFDITGFLNFYDHLRSLALDAPTFELDPAPPHILISGTWGNVRSAKTYGIEIASRWDVLDRWKLVASYTLLNQKMKSDLGVADLQLVTEDVPQHQFQIRSTLDLPHHIQFDTAFYFADNLTFTTGSVPRNLKLDLRLGWKPVKKLDLSVVAQNLIEGNHQEFQSGIIVPTQIGRTVYGKATWKF